MAFENRLIDSQEWINVRWHGELIRTTVGRVDLQRRRSRRSGTIRSSTTSSTRRRAQEADHRCATASTATPRRRGSSTRSRGWASTSRRMSGTTVSISDIVVPQAKYDILDKAQSEVDELHRLFDQGFISEDEQYNKTIEVWSKAVGRRHAAPCRRRRTRSTRSS